VTPGALVSVLDTADLLDGVGDGPQVRGSRDLASFSGASGSGKRMEYDPASAKRFIVAVLPREEVAPVWPDDLQCARVRRSAAIGPNGGTRLIGQYRRTDHRPNAAQETTCHRGTPETMCRARIIQERGRLGY